MKQACIYAFSMILTAFLAAVSVHYGFRLYDRIIYNRDYYRCRAAYPISAICPMLYKGRP